MATKPPPQNPVLPEQRELFDLFVKKWQGLLNLSDWRLIKKGGKTKYMAEMVLMETKHKLATYRLGHDFGETPVNAKSLESTAIHELLHLRLHELTEIAISELMYSDAVLAVEHSVITVLENLLMELATRQTAEEAASYGGTD